MGSFTAIYLKCDADEETAVAMVKDVLSEFPTAESPVLRSHGDAWLHLSESGDGYIDEDLASALSKKIQNETIFVDVQTVVDAIRYEHFKNGSEVRRLWKGTGIGASIDDMFEEGEWALVDGSPQPWESEVFWSDGATAEALEDFDTPDVREIYEKRRIKLGHFLPTFDLSDLAEAVGFTIFFEKAAGWEREL